MTEIERWCQRPREMTLPNVLECSLSVLEPTVSFKSEVSLKRGKSERERGMDDGGRGERERERDGEREREREKGDINLKVA